MDIHSAFIYVQVICPNMQRCRAENHRRKEPKKIKKGERWAGPFFFHLQLLLLRIDERGSGKVLIENDFGQKGQQTMLSADFF